MRYSITLILCLIIFSCNSDDLEVAETIPLDTTDYSEQNEQEINEYLNRNNLVSEKSETGLHYIILNPGEGIQANKDSNVTVVYKGYFLDETVYEEGPAEGLTEDLSAFIEGFGEGMTYFKEGGDGTLFIPAHLGYGNRGYLKGISASTVLVFDIQLVSVN